MFHLAADFDLVVRIAFWTGQVAVLATLAILIFVLVSRARFQSRQLEVTRLIGSWRPLLAEVAFAGYAQSSITMPKLARGDRQLFLHEWNSVHESLTGEPLDELTAFGREFGLDKLAWKWLDHRELSKRLLAIATLGHMREADAWEPLFLQLESTESLLSLMAARALAQIDPHRAMPVIIPYIVKREDWTAGRVASILTRAGADAVVGPFLDSLARATPEDAIILLNLVRVVPAPFTENSIRDLLKEATNPNLISACLKELHSPEHLPTVRPLTRHELWYVRLNAIEFLGRAGSRKDMKYLIRALQDSEWWVRYRAAQALCRLPWIDTEKLRQIQSRREDPFAIDILEQVISESKFA